MAGGAGLGQVWPGKARHGRNVGVTPRRCVKHCAVDTAETLPTDWAVAIARAENPFHVSIARYARAPIAFVREVLGAEPDPWQMLALRALAHGHTRLSIRSGHGVGKTAFAAWSVVWFCCTRAPFKVAVTAPTSPQLEDALLPEIKKWFARLPEGWRNLFDITAGHIKLKSDAECFVTARTSRPETPEAMAGIHSANVLLVVDEASGVPEPVFEAGSGSMSTEGAITLLIGNPTRSTGFFWRTQTIDRGRWWTLRVSAQDSPRVARSFPEEIGERYGLDSNAYRVRVLGEFPLADDDTLIPAGLVDAAMHRDIPIDVTQPEIWGVDCARFGNDASVLIKRRGNVVPEMPRRWRNLDTMQLAGAIKHEYERQGVKPILICIDSIGLGAGVVDRLNEQNLPVLGVNVSETPSISGRYARLRDELWIRTREWLESRNVRLPYDEALRDDLAAPRFAFLSDGRMQVESKNSMRARGLPSPDSADALIHTFADAGLAIGMGGQSGLHATGGMLMDLRGMDV